MVVEKVIFVTSGKKRRAAFRMPRGSFFALGTKLLLFASNEANKKMHKTRYSNKQKNDGAGILFIYLNKWGGAYMSPITVGSRSAE